MNLAEALAKFDEEFVMNAIQTRLGEGEDPIRLVLDLQEGMNLIGERFSSGDYFLAELLMSADLFTRAMKLVEPHLSADLEGSVGRIVIGTPKGDIHDLGKNIFCTVAKGAGFEVHDLGVDVPVERFVQTVEEVRPHILGFSALITPTFKPMKEVVDILVQKGLRDELKVIIGGGVTTQTVRRYVGADTQTIDALQGLRACRDFVKQAE